MSTPIRTHQPCPDCGSSDALTEYSDGHTYCFSCETTHGATTAPTEEKVQSSALIPLGTLEAITLSSRGISKETCNEYIYLCGKYKGKPVQVACYYDDGGNLIGQKVRFPDKTFVTLGKISNNFFGQQKFSGGKGKLVITEGEIDCLSVSQVQGNKYPVISLPCGCTSAKRVIERNLEWLSTFDEVILMFDMDDAGRKACAEAAPLLRNSYIASLPLKDANECLKASRGKDILNAIWNAKKYKPDGIINGNELWDRIQNKKEIPSVTYPWKDSKLQKMTGGIRKGEIVMITAGTGVGKTTFFKQVMYDLAVKKGKRVGTLMLEESVERTGVSLMSMHVQKPLYLNSNVVSSEEYKKAYDETLGTGNFELYDHFGSVDRDGLLAKIRYLIVSAKCEYIFLDHLTIAVSGLDIKRGTEVQLIDYLMSHLRSIAEETQCCLFIICHLSRPDRKEKSHEEGGQVSLRDLRGSQGTSQLTDIVIALERDLQSTTERNVLKVRILKNRFLGETGVAGYLQFNKSTGILTETTPPNSNEEEASF